MSTVIHVDFTTRRRTTAAVALERPEHGTACQRCGERVDPRKRAAMGDGVAWHVECWARDMGVRS